MKGLLVALALVSSVAAADPLPDTPAVVVDVQKASLDAKDGKTYEAATGTFLNLQASMDLAKKLQSKDKELIRLRQNNAELATTNVPVVAVLSAVVLSLAAGYAVARLTK
jgi:hypothetical protein